MNAQDIELTEVTSKSLGGLEASVWDDGSITIEHWMKQFTPDDETLPYLQLTNGQARRLRGLLNSPKSKKALGVPSLAVVEHIKRDPAQAVNLGSISVELNEEGMTLGTGRFALTLNSGETYRLFTVLHEIFK